MIVYGHLLKCFHRAVVYMSNCHSFRTLKRTQISNLLLTSSKICNLIAEF